MVVGLIVAIASFVLRTLGILDLGELPLYIGGAIAAVGLILTIVAFWLRRQYRMQGQLRDVEIDRRLRGRSEMEAELRDAEAATEQQLGSLGLDDFPMAEDLLGREEAHVARMDQLAAQLDGLVGKEPRETLAAQRDAAALEIEQKTGALEALGPIAKEPRARERLEVEVRDQEHALERARDDEANARARVEANAVDAEEVAGQAERLAVWREQLGGAPAPPPGPRRDAQGDRSRRGGHDEDRDPLPRGPHGPRPGRGDRRSLPSRPGRRQDARHRGPCPRARRLGPGHRPEPGHPRPRLPRGASRPRPTRHRRPPSAARLRRSVRDPGRRAGRAGAEPAEAGRPGLPDHLPDDVGSLRRSGRRGRRVAGSDGRGRRRDRPARRAPSQGAA